jgi:hypothetical protein
LARALTSSVIHRARRRIAEKHPEWNEQQVASEWARLSYGEEVVDPSVGTLSRRGQLD